MKLILTLSLFLSGFLCVTCQAQIDFENGYFIKNDGQKISCLIRNYGWRNNPTKFVYKENENAPAKTITLDEVVEFGILPGVKYQRYTVKLDTSDDNLESMSKSWLPEFRQQQVFLKVLVEGKASLYIYRTREWTRFFFRINDTTPEPLIFKRYSKNDGTISENFSYVSQIRDSLSCASMQLDNAPAFSYEARALSRLFIAYNTCSNACYTDYRAKDAKTLFHLNIRPGLNLSDLVVKENANNGSSGDTHYPYGQKLSVRIGAEAEFVLNFGKNKWAIIFEPAYQYYKVNSTTQNINTVASYKTLEMTPGVRYYMFLKPGSKLYLTGSLFYDIPFNAYVDLGNIDFSVKPRINAAFSVGYQYIDKFSIELKYALPSQIIDYYLYFGARLNTTSLIFAYRLF